jgi:hypothetical protein
MDNGILLGMKNSPVLFFRILFLVFEIANSIAVMSVFSKVLFFASFSFKTSKNDF